MATIPDHVSPSNVYRSPWDIVIRLNGELELDTESVCVHLSNEGGTWLVRTDVWVG